MAIASLDQDGSALVEQIAGATVNLILPSGNNNQDLTDPLALNQNITEEDDPNQEENSEVVNFRGPSWATYV